MTTVTTSATNGLAYTMTPVGVANAGPRRTESPNDLIATRAVQLKEGWVGQVWVDRTVVWQSAPQGNEGRAQRKANDHLVKRLLKLLG